MRRLTFLISCTLVVAMWMPHCHGGELGKKAWHSFWAGYYRNKHWPEPFQTLDRQAVMHPIELMKNNGWRRHNTLGDQLFVAETNELTTAAEIKIHWIATQAPMARRTVFVYGHAKDPNTQARVVAVRNYLTELNPSGHTPGVMITDVIPRGASGEVYNQVMSGYQNSLPAPVLPENAAEGG